jgi:cellulose synthase operon protein C
MSLTRPLRFALLLSLLSLQSLAAQKKPAAPGPPPPQVDQAARKYEAGDLKGAIALLEPLRKKPGAHPSALALLGTLYLETGRPKDALALLGPIADSGAAGPVILHNAGRAALALGQMEKAEAYLQGAAAKAPVSPASRDLGLLLGSQGRAAESYQQLRPWVEAHPEDQASRLSAAYDALELDRPREAAELLAGLPEDEPRVRLLKGRVQLLQSEPRQTVATLEPLLKAGASAIEPEVRRYLAEAHLALGESAAAVTLLQGLPQGRLGADPSLALLLGRAQLQAGNPEQAAATLAPVARELEKPGSAAAQDDVLATAVALEYGRALVATAKWPEAVASLVRATQLDPQNVQAWQVLGQAQLGAGRREEAAHSIERFRQLQSAEKSVSEQVKESEAGAADATGRNLGRATTLLNQGKADEALAIIRQEVALAPANDPRPRAAEVTALLAMKRNDEALKTAEAALAAAPGNPDYLYLRGAVHMARQQLPEAEKDFRQTLQIRPDHLAALNDLAVLDMTLGRTAEARELLQKVLALRPGDPRATANLKSLDEKK